MQFTGFADNNNDDTRKLTKAEKKALEAMNDSINHFWANHALDKQEFAVLAKRLRFRNGQYVTVNDYTNFITVKDNEAIIQIALERGMSGLNGLGGITLKGKITKANKTVTKKGAINYTMAFNGQGTSCNVRINVSKTGNWCEANISSNFSGFSVTMTGELIPYVTDNEGLLIRKNGKLSIEDNNEE